MSRPTEAECLLSLANALQENPTELLVVRGHFCDHCLANMSLALRLQRKGPAFCLRAVFEGWNRERIIRELW